MSGFDWNSSVIAPLLVVFVSAAAFASGKVYLLGKEKKALKRKLAGLQKELAASEAHRKEHLHTALDRYREEIDRQQKQFEIAKMSHGEVKEFAAFLLRFIEREHPRWLQDRIDGKPEYDLVFTPPPPARPAPKPRQADVGNKPPV